MHKVLFVTCLLLLVISGYGQAFSPLPPEVTPKGAPPGLKSAPIQEPKSLRSPNGDKPINPDQPNLTFQAIIIVKTKDEIQQGGVPSANGLQVKGVPILESPDFARMVESRFLGKIITENAIRDLQDAIILYCRERGKLLVDVILPEQDIGNGVLQLWFLEGKVGKVTVKNEGVKWFHDQFIKSSVRLRPAEPLDAPTLSKDLDWLNNNPFREVGVQFRPGERLGLTDVQLEVNDRIPFRPYVGYEDSGTRFTGPDRLIGGFNWGNALFLDHQLNYQYTTDTHFDLIRAHSMSYVAPLPWRHSITLYGAYVDAKAQLTGGGTSANGTSWQISGRYAVPLPDFEKYRHQVALGFDFKRGNNNLLAGGAPQIASDTDIAQFVLAYSGSLPDRFGKTSGGLELYYSPGNLTEFNNNEDFGGTNGLRQASKADYFYGRLNVERVTRLPWNFSWLLTGWAQYSTARLLPSEELALGGYNTVRGYDERVVLGDVGWIINNEVRTPPLALSELLNVPAVHDELQLLAFFDYGYLRVRNVQQGDRPNTTLYSTGVGLRYSLRHNLSIRFDYGFPLTEKGLNEHDSRMHLGALLSF